MGRVIVPVVKRAAKEAAEEAIRGEIEKRIGSDGRILTEILVGAGHAPSLEHALDAALEKPRGDNRGITAGVPTF